MSNARIITVGSPITVVTTTGQEFVGVYGKSDDVGFNLGKPKMIVFDQDKMGFARGVCATSEDNPVSIYFHNAGVSFIATPDASIVSAYENAIEQDEKSKQTVYTPESKIIV